MKKTRILALIMTVVMVTCLVAGCGDKGNTDGDITEITIWSSDTHAKAFMTEKVDEFNKTIGKENKIKLVMDIKEDAQQQLKIALQSGTEPDLFGVSSLSEFAENDYMVPLDEVPGIEETVAKNSSFKFEGTNVWNGKMYILPISSKIYGLAYNKDMFKAAGIVDENGEAKAPETLDEMVEAAKKLTDKSKQQYGIIIPIKWSGWYGCELSNPSRGVSGLINGIYNPATGKYDYSGIKPLAGALLEMKKNGSVYPGAEGLDNDPARARFAEGNIGMKMCATWDVGVWNDQFKAKCDWGVAPVPSTSKDEKYYHLKEPGFSLAIGRRGLEKKGADKIALVYNWLYSDEMLKDECEAGIVMPWRSDIVENSNLTNVKTGWADYCNLVTICGECYGTMPRDISAYDADNVDFVNRVWSGQITLDEWIKERTEISNKGIELFKKNNPDKDYSDRYVPDYDPIRK